MRQEWLNARDRWSVSANLGKKRLLCVHIHTQTLRQDDQTDQIFRGSITRMSNNYNTMCAFVFTEYMLVKSCVMPVLNEWIYRLLKTFFHSYVMLHIFQNSNAKDLSLVGVVVTDCMTISFCRETYWKSIDTNLLQHFFSACPTHHFGHTRMRSNSRMSRLHAWIF